MACHASVELRCDNGFTDWYILKSNGKELALYRFVSMAKVRVDEVKEVNCKPTDNNIDYVKGLYYDWLLGVDRKK